MALRRLLIANRGEIAIRIARSAADLGIRTVGVYATDDAQTLHVARVDEAVALGAAGPAAYLDIDALVRVARDAGCDAVHPGYGFLSESAVFANACAAAGLVFVGPSPDTLRLFGDKGEARALAAWLSVPVPRGIDRAVSVDEATGFFDTVVADGAAGVMIKAIAGGGGRGMRPVMRPTEIAAAFDLCGTEARLAFGNADLYVEELLPACRHVEVQIVGDGVHHAALGDRDCTVQRSRQKFIEIAPAPGLSDDLRGHLAAASLAMADAAKLHGVATFEFLVFTSPAGETRFAFVEANPRIQVEHTVTEAVLGIDLVRAQLLLAGGASLAEAGIDAKATPQPRGTAIQLRINAERIAADGSVRPGAGVLRTFDLAGGPGIRWDTHGFSGGAVSPRFDSLLAKLIVHAPSGMFADAVAKTARALRECRIEGVDTNIDLLAAVLADPRFVAGEIDTTYVETHLAELLAHVRPVADPLAILRAGSAPVSDTEDDLPDDPDALRITVPMHGTVVVVETAEGDVVQAGWTLLVVEAMKMQHVIAAPVAGRVLAVRTTNGATVAEGDVVIVLVPDEVAGAVVATEADADHGRIRPDLAEVHGRQWNLRDEARPEAVARRRGTGSRTARENIDDLCDPGSFQEMGGLVIAAQRSRRTLDDLITRTPADGLVMGIGRVNGERFPDHASRCAVMAYDYTVLAGTQGSKNHEKMDRLLELAARQRLPMVVYAEGGGGRPGDTDTIGAGTLHIPGFTLFAQLSGKVPLVAIVSGRCFAGNAVLAGCSDVIIATENASLGMGGPAMIEGGGLGVFHPDAVGPAAMHARSGAADLVVRDEAEATAVAKRYLAYFQGAVPDWTCTDQRRLRDVVPEHRLRAYDVHRAIDVLADDGSVLELRPRFAPNMVTALVRIEGRPMGLLANNAMHLGGAIDAGAADKAARFLQLCDAHGLPVLSLCDTPGNMVGPEAEKTALVRHCCRLYVIGANVRVPMISVVLRKAYGLGAQGMVGGSFHRPVLSVAWPTGEFGPMNLEGAVKLGFRKELEALADPAERAAEFERLVEEAYERGKALSAASLFEIDDVIDPADTRERIVEALRALPAEEPRSPARWIDTW
jgi:acetyl/propionyl-CoA carboxylase alpha subunit